MFSHSVALGTVKLFLCNFISHFGYCILCTKLSDLVHTDDYSNISILIESHIIPICFNM